MYSLLKVVDDIIGSAIHNMSKRRIYTETSNHNPREKTATTKQTDVSALETNQETKEQH